MRQHLITAACVAVGCALGWLAYMVTRPPRYNPWGPM